MAGIRIYRSLEEAAPHFGPSALTIGNFDGVHAGHRLIFRRAAEIGRRNGWKPSVLTFDPHPARVTAPERAPRLLSAPERRCEWMAEAGMEQVAIVPFDAAFSRQEAGEFVEEVLVKTLGVKAVLVGENFRFGLDQRGNVRTLRELGERFGFLTEVIAGFRLRGRMVSSSEVRRLIEAGRVEMGGRLLGRWYALEGEVVAGRGVGSRRTVPTLNLATPAEVLPPNGVYVTRTRDLDSARRWPSVTNIGHRPTFDAGSLSIETHLLTAIEGAAPRRIAVEFLWRLRDELRFETPEALRAQILSDARRAWTYFRRLERWTSARSAAARLVPGSGPCRTW